MGRKLFEDGDKVEVTVDGKTSQATIAQYDTNARKVIVKYEGQEEVDQTWIPIKNVAKLDDKGKPIKRERSRSRTRGQSPARTPAAKKATSPKKAVSTRTRSKSRDRSKPTAAGDANTKKLVNPADFSADEEAINTPAAATTRGRTTSKKSSESSKKAAAASKSQSPSRERKASTKSKTATKAGAAKNASKTAAVAAAPKPAPLKDPDFSADEEEANIEKIVEANSNTEDFKEPAAAKTCGLRKMGDCICQMSQKIAGCLRVKTGCTYMGACQGVQWTCCQTVAALKFLWAMSVLMFKTIITNIPMVLTYYVTNMIVLFLIDKKNVKLSQFYPENFVLPTLPDNPFLKLDLLSLDLAVQQANLMTLVCFLKYPVVMLLAFHSITQLQNFYDGYKIVVGANPRKTTVCNLRKVWLTYMLVTAFVMYFESFLPYVDQYFPEVLTNPVTPYFRNGLLYVNSQLYEALTCIFLNSKKFYFTLILLATFKAYQDFNFDLSTSWKKWFLNDELSVSYDTRFNVTFGLEIFEQLAYLVLAVKNPGNKFLWFLVNMNFWNAFLTTRSSDSNSDKSQTIEGMSIKRFYQGSLTSGFWFYFYNLYKLFCYMSFWRFINKAKVMTSNPYQLGAFFLVCVIATILKFSSHINFPPEKRFGIHGKIRNAERLSEILHVFSLSLLCDCKFGNAPCVISTIYIILQILDLHISEECCLSRSQNKWKTYFNKVEYRLIPRVY